MGTLETFVRIFKFLKVELNEEQRNLIIKFSNENNQIYRDPNFDQFDQENGMQNLILYYWIEKNMVLILD